MRPANLISALLLTVLAISGLGLPDIAAADVKYKKATYVEKQSCKNRFPATSRYSKARFNLLKGGCWSCPAGFERTALPAPDEHKSCKKPRPYIDAKFHSHAKGVFHNVCKGEPWLKDKKCWTCPPGFKRSNKVSDGKPQCKPETKNYYHPATLRGDAGCGDGLWSPSFNNNCYRCPSGYFRNPLRTTADRAEDSKACMTYEKSKQEQADFVRKHLAEAQHHLTAHSDLVAKAGEFQKKISRIIKRKGGIKNLTKDDIRQAGGLSVLMASCGQDFWSITITGGGDASYVVGVNGSAGLAFGLKGECKGTQDGADWIDRNTDFGVMWLATVNVSGGVSFGLDASVNVGVWRIPYDKLWGFAHGVVVGGSYAQYGLNGSAWWTIDWGPAKGEFAGVSVGYQGGLSAEGEYDWGYTVQEGTFGCSRVKIEATNNTGRRVKVIDVDYHDYSEGKWHSEPTKNTEISNGGTYRKTANLETVGGKKTQIRVKYRVKEGNGWSGVIRAWSSDKLPCEKGKTYAVDLTATK